MMTGEASGEAGGDAKNAADLRGPLWRRVINYPLVAMVIALIGVIAAIVGLGTGLAWLFDALGADTASDGFTITATIVSALAAFLAYKLIVSRLGCPPRDYLPMHGALSPLVIGIAAGALIMTLAVAVIALFGGYRLIGWGTGSSWVMILFAAGVQAAVVEEIVFRGIAFSYLEEFGGSWFALFLTSAFFGLAHAANPGANLFSTIAIMVEAGVVLGAALMVTRSLWVPIGLHFGWNVTQGLVWDVPVSGNAVDGLVEAEPEGAALLSGGAFGIEASLVTVIMCGALGVYLAWLAWQRGDVQRPIWRRPRAERA